MRHLGPVFLLACTSTPPTATGVAPQPTVQPSPTVAPVTPPCTTGSTRPSTTPCGLDGAWLEECRDGVWEATDVCESEHPDDAALLEAAEAETLAFQCLGQPLSTEDILQRMPEGDDTWTPDPLQNTATAEQYLERYYRDCSDLTGCSDWRTSGIDTGDLWSFGFRLDPEHRLNILQQEHDGVPGSPTAVLTPVDGGQALVTLGLEAGFAEQKRFFVQASEGCFSLTTLAARIDVQSGSWTEEMYGLVFPWDWDLPPRTSRPPAPSLPDTACPQASTDTAAIASAWFSPGSTRTEFSGSEWAHNNNRWCTDLTGCTEWASSDGLASVVLQVVDGSIEVEVTGERIEVASDGTFASEIYSGWITPDCMRIDKSEDLHYAGRASRWEWRASRVHHPD